MAAKQASKKAKSQRVFGEARKPAKMFRADSAGSYHVALWSYRLLRITSKAEFPGWLRVKCKLNGLLPG